MPAQRTSLRRAERPVGIDQEFRHEEQRNAARAGRRIGQARQHEMDDVRRVKIVLAIGDEDLLAEDAVGAVAGALGARAHQRARSEPACGSVRFIVAGPFAGDELAADRRPSARR